MKIVQPYVYLVDKKSSLYVISYEICVLLKDLSVTVKKHM